MKEVAGWRPFDADSHFVQCLHQQSCPVKVNPVDVLGGQVAKRRLVSEQRLMKSFCSGQPRPLR